MDHPRLAYRTRGGHRSWLPNAIHASPQKLIGYIVQSVPSRRDLRNRLLLELPPAVVVEDTGPPPGNPWRGYQLCLNSFTHSESEWTHAVVIQDDAIVCRGFVATVERVIEAMPDRPICLFYPGLPMHSARNVRIARTRGSTLFLLHRRDFIPVVAVVWPREKAEHLLHWTSGDRKIPALRKPYRSDDAVTGSWMRLTRQDVYVTLPSLVQHPDDAESVKDGPQKASFGRDKGRVALEFREDPGEIEWRV